ncbi:MAG: hypothetical protein ABUS48_02005 [Pseudomonadota bacterium]
MSMVLESERDELTLRSALKAWLHYCAVAILGAGFMYASALSFQVQEGLAPAVTAARQAGHAVSYPVRLLSRVVTHNI